MLDLAIFGSAKLTAALMNPTVNDSSDDFGGSPCGDVEIQADALIQCVTV